MNRRTLLTFGAAVSGVVALTLFIGWWQVDGPPSSTLGHGFESYLAMRWSIK